MSEINKTLYVEGMHCAACESLIEQRMNDKKWVKDAKASLKDNKVDLALSGNAQIDTAQLNEEFKDLGYSFSETPEVKRNENLIKALIIVAATIGLFILNEKSGFLTRFSLNEESGVVSYFIFGIAAGLSSCAALTGGILITLSKTWSGIYTGGNRHLPFTMFNIGRLASFAFFGGLLGLLGSFFASNVTLSAVFIIIVSLLMAFFGLQMLDLKWIQGLKIRPPEFFQKYTTDKNNFTGQLMPLMIGAATFFLPCGFTIIAQTNALTTGSFKQSAILLLSFALGTLPTLALISYTSLKIYSKNKYSKIFSYVAGILVFFFALFTINSQLNVLGAPSISSLIAKEPQKVQKVVAINNDAVQIIEITGKGFEYYPTYIELEANKPTELRFYNVGVYGCASAMVGRGLFDGVVRLKQGLNTLNFTPIRAGTYRITCSMGMVPPVTVVVK